MFFCFAIVAPNIVGTLLAGENLMIQGKSADGETVVFQVDETGAKLHNAEFNIFSHGQQIALNPDIGIAIGKEPVYTKDEKTGGFTFNKSNAAFYVDIESGDAYFRGTVQANKYLDKSGHEMMTKDYQFTADYLDLHGLTICNQSGTTTLRIDQNGNISMRGDITLNNGAPSGTFISGTNIYSPTIQSPTIEWYENNGDLLGLIKQGEGKNDGVPTVLLEMVSAKGISLHAKNGGISLIADNGGIWFSSRAAALNGVDVSESFRIKGTCYTPAHNSNGWTDIIAAFKDIERRLNTAESNIGGLSSRISTLESQ